MKKTDTITGKILSLPQLLAKAAAIRVTGKTIAFTNGVFDLLHAGHLHSLNEAAATADFLVVGVNSDASVKRLKGPSRPVQTETTRAMVLAALLVTDAVIIFEEDTPQALIAALLPDVLVKGGDYTVEQIAGAKEVIESGGKVVINKIIEGHSTTATIFSISNEHKK